MRINPVSRQKKIKKTAAWLCLLNVVALLFARQAFSAPTEDKLDYFSELQVMARAYREQGLKEQQLGNLEEAMVFYQKAIELDASYAVAYNDLGVIYEANGWLDRAEDAYLWALKLDPRLLSAYTNLALMYENKRQLEKAYSYWKKRAELGLPSDPWTQKARRRIKDLMQVIPSLKQVYMEQEAIKLMRITAEKKRLKKLEELEKSQEYLAEAEKLYNKAEYKEAIKKLKLALALDPANPQIQDLLKKARLKLKEQLKQAKLKELKKSFQEGMQYYQQDDLQAAKRRFEKIVELTAPPQKK